MQIEPYIIISDCHNLFSHICPFRKIICFCQILYIFCKIVFSFTKKFYYLLPHQFCKSLSGAKQVIKAQLKYVFPSNKLLTNARFKPFPRLFKIPSIENRHRIWPADARSLPPGKVLSLSLLYKKNLPKEPHTKYPLDAFPSLCRSHLRSGF